MALAWLQRVVGGGYASSCPVGGPLLGLALDWPLCRPFSDSVHCHLHPGPSLEKLNEGPGGLVQDPARLP